MDFAPTQTYGSNLATSGPLVRRMNRLVLRTSCLEDLHRLFSGCFGLAATGVWWDGGFRSTRFFAGSVVIDCGESEGGQVLAPMKQPYTQLTGISFEPAIPTPTVCSMLLRRGVRVCCQTHCMAEGKRPVQTLALLDIVQPHGENVRHALQVSELDAMCCCQHATPPRSPLWMDVTEVWAETNCLEDARHRWGALLDPERPDAAGAWRFHAGPSLRLHRGAANGLRGFVVTTPSFANLAETLRARRIDYRLGKRYLQLSPRASGELEILFTEVKPVRRWMQ